MGNQTVPAFHREPFFSAADLEGKEKLSALFIMGWEEEEEDEEVVLTVMLSQCVGGGSSIRAAHDGGRLSNSLSGFCLSLNVQPCSGQSGSKEGGQERSAERGGGCERPICGPAHFSPLTGEIEGRTGQRRDSSRAADAEEVEFGPEPWRGVDLCGLGQDDQVAEGKASVMGPRLDSEDGSGAGREGVSGWDLRALSLLLRDLCDGRRTPDTGRGGRCLGWSKIGSFSAGVVDDWEGLDSSGRGGGEGKHITGHRWSGEEQAASSGSETLLSAAKQAEKSLTSESV